MQDGITRINAEQYEGKVREKGMERQFAVTSTPEGVAATQQALTSAPPAASPGAAPVGAGSPAAPQQTPARLTAASKRSKWRPRLRRRKRSKNTDSPQKEIQDVRALDDMYTKGTRLLQLGQGNPAKGIPGLIERYGNYPGTFFDWMQSIKSATGSMDPELKRVREYPEWTYSISRKEFTGTATSLNERKDLVAWIPDKSTNVATRSNRSATCRESRHQRPQTQHRAHRGELPLAPTFLV